MVELPRRRPGISNDKLLIKKDYSYSDIAGNNIDANQINAIVISIDDLSASMDKLIELLDHDKEIQLKFKDFESVIFIDKILKRRIINKTFLMDDSLRKDREYIDLTILRNINLTIPLNYLMWGVKFNDSIETYCFLINNPQSNYLNPTSINGNKKLSYDDYVSISRKIEELSKFNCKNEKEKVALISDYIQSQTQYIDGYESVSSKGTFITPDFPEYIDYRSKSGLVETVINDNNGVCMGIANASTLLLNNPQVDLEVESVYGCSHVWNKVLIDGKYYYFDNTWSITRNENMSEEGLIGLSFTRKYLLFGQKTANAIGHHDPQSIFIYDDGVISEEDIDNINYQSKFVYQKGPIYRSKKKY